MNKYTIEDLCNIFSKSECSIRLYNKELSITGTREGKRIFYSEEDKLKLEKFLKDNPSTRSYFTRKNRIPKAYDDYYTFSQLCEIFHKDFNTLERILNHLNIINLDICKKPRLYAKEDKEKIENCLEK